MSRFSNRRRSPRQPNRSIEELPLTFTHNSGLDRSLADEAQGPLAQLLAIPQDGGDDSETDPLAALKADIRTARGKALLLETTAAGFGEGRSAAPRRDWMASRLGPHPPESMAQVQKQSFAAVLAATGTPPSLFVDADGTAQREAVRRWHLGTVLPLARILEAELSDKLEADVRLQFDAYPLDLAGRAMAFQKLVAGGVPVSEALGLRRGLLAEVPREKRFELPVSGASDSRASITSDGGGRPVLLH